MIPVETVSIGVSCVMARRVRCEHCVNVYNYITLHFFAKAEAGLPLLMSDRMKSAVGKAVTNELQKIAKKEKAGFERCPFCGLYQPWMLSTARMWGALGGLLTGGLLAWAVSDSVPLEAYIFIPVAAVAACFLGWFLTGMICGGKSLAANPNVKSDDALRRHLEMYKAREDDPFIAWKFPKGFKGEEGQIAVSLGLLDLTGQNQFAEHSTRAALKNMPV